MIDALSLGTAGTAGTADSVADSAGAADGGTWDLDLTADAEIIRQVLAGEMCWQVAQERLERLAPRLKRTARRVVCITANRRTGAGR